jgi:hypothetical protein
MENKELKPCKCGCKDYEIYHEKYGEWLYVCAIGCLNIVCDESMVMASAGSAQDAEKLAVQRWNRRANDGT